MNPSLEAATPKVFAALVGFGAVVLWSGLALSTTALSGETPPFELAAITFAIGGVCGLVYAAARRPKWMLAQPWRVWLVGIGGLFGYHALYFAALRRAPPAEASLIAYLSQLLIVMFSAALPGERLRVRHVAGAALGFAGAATLLVSTGERVSSYGRTAFIGYGLALCCAFVWSAYSLLSRSLKEAPTEAVAGYCLRDRGARRAIPRSVRDHGDPGRRRAMAGHSRTRPRAGRPRILHLGFWGQARRHPAARGGGLCSAGPFDADPGVGGNRARDAGAGARQRADRRRRRRRIARDLRRTRSRNGHGPPPGI